MNIFAVPWARLFSKCAVIASRRWWYDAPRPGLVTLNRWCNRLAHRVLANSRSVAGLLAKEEGVAANKIVEIPNFLSPSAYEPLKGGERTARLRTWGIPEDSFVIGIVARLTPVKNHSLLLKAVAGLKANCHLLVIGDGPMRGDLEELAGSLGIRARVHFAGEVMSSQNLHCYFDVSVLCSHSEGFPNSVIEAMAAGNPVVATAVGGVTDALKDKIHGMLVPVDDPEPMTEALRSLEHDSDLRKRLGAAGRESAQSHYREEIVVGKLVELYQILAGVSGASRAEQKLV